MKKTVILVDYENVKPDFSNLELEPGIEIKVFLSKKTPQIKGDVHPSLNLERVATAAAGKNALDFHLVLYLGKAATLNPDVEFIILSNDKGFDTLYQSLKKDGVTVSRRAAILDTTGPARGPDENLFDNWLGWLKKKLKDMRNKPKTISSFVAYFFPQVEAAVRKKKIAGHSDLPAMFHQFLMVLTDKRVILPLDSGKIELAG